MKLKHPPSYILTILLGSLLSVFFFNLSCSQEESNKASSSDSKKLNQKESIQNSELFSLFPKSLINRDGETVPATVLSGKTVGIYFSAQWCPPCRGFTPSLVDFRNKNSENFEVVFVSSDRSAEDQLKYMEKYEMNFYAVPHGSDAANNLKKKFEVRGIPSLIIVDANGNTITKNGRGDVSGNPDGALASWQKGS